MHTQRLESRGEPCMPTDPTTGEATPGGPLRPRAPPRVRTRCTRPADASHLPRSDHGPVSLPERTMSTRPRKTPARDVSRATLRRRWNGTWATREKIAGRSTREDQLSGSMRASSTAPPRHHVSSRAGVIPTTSTSARRGERGPRRRVYRHAVNRGPVVNTTGRDRPRHDETPRRDDTPRRHAETRDPASRRHAETRRDSASRRHAETSRRRVETRRDAPTRRRPPSRVEASSQLHHEPARASIRTTQKKTAPHAELFSFTSCDLNLRPRMMWTRRGATTSEGSHARGRSCDRSPRRDGRPAQCASEPSR